VIGSVHQALCAWADYKTLSKEQDARCEIGYNKSTVEGRAANGELPGTGNKAKRQGRSKVPVSLMINATISHVDRIVEELPASLRVVVKGKYLGKGENDSERVKRFCMKWEMSYRTFMRRLHEAHDWLRDRGIGGN